MHSFGSIWTVSGGGWQGTIHLEYLVELGNAKVVGGKSGRVRGDCDQLSVVKLAAKVEKWTWSNPTIVSTFIVMSFNVSFCSC